MRQPWEWGENDISELIEERVQENLSLDYKACASLARTDLAKKEISKDVSAFANSAGGTIVYGVTEKDTFPEAIDAGYDPKVIGREWLENVINAGIQRRIDGVRINPVQLTSKPGRVLYVVSIPSSLRAPHMASDNRFYKRFNFQSVPMEEYEVRDVGRRNETPDLRLEMHIANFAFPVVRLAVRIANSAPEPAYHAIVRLYFDQSIEVLAADGLIKLPHVQTIPYRAMSIPMQVLTARWSVPPNLPIWADESQSLTGNHVDLSYSYRGRPATRPET